MTNCYAPNMAMPSEIQHKFWRVKLHHDELLQQVKEWFESGPGELKRDPDSAEDANVYIFVPSEPVPARFGLIAGDFLQNLRSTLDYLVWQLVLANGNTPKRCNAFPVCLTLESYINALARNRLKGVPDKAIEVIKALQPAFTPSTPHPHPMYVLDELTNTNKHRSPLMTAFTTALEGKEPPPFPHVKLQVSRFREGRAEDGERILAYLTFKHSLIAGMEVLSALYMLSNYIGIEVLPQFDAFF